MNTPKKNKFLYGVLSLICLIAIFSYYSFADTRSPVSHDSDVPRAVKIPPPIEGVERPTTVEQIQKLEQEDIKIFTSIGENYVFHVEIAKTIEQQKKGMMYRNNVKPLTGMLFLFNDSRERSFWMKNTLVSLDLLFIRSDGIIHSIHHNATPESLDSIKSNGKAKAVLEIAGGEAKRLNIAIGDLISHGSFASEPSP